MIIIILCSVKVLAWFVYSFNFILSTYFARKLSCSFCGKVGRLPLSPSGTAPTSPPFSIYSVLSVALSCTDPTAVSVSIPRRTARENPHWRDALCLPVLRQSQLSWVFGVVRSEWVTLTVLCSKWYIFKFLERESHHDQKLFTLAWLTLAAF